MGFRALDIENREDLLAYLRASGHIETSEEPSVRVLAGGVSNRTVLVGRAFSNAGERAPDEDINVESWVIKQALEKLRVEVDWFSDPERIHREAMGIRWLARLAPPGVIAPLVFEDYEHHLLAMEAVPEPHQNWKEMLLQGRLECDHIEQFASLLGTVHRNVEDHWNEVASEFEDRTFFESLRLEPYYGYTAEQVPRAADFLWSLIQETLSRRDSLVHGDYSPKNVLIRKGRLILLDHEVIHFGDPAFDLGFSITHLLSKANHLSEMRPEFAEATKFYWSTYERSVMDFDWARDIEERAVRHTLGCLLARVKGRSPLEYLTDSQRDEQLEAVVALTTDPPETIDGLVDEFIERIER